jgi:hypothetical protein
VNLIDNLAGRPLGTTAAVDLGTEVVYHHAGPLAGKLQSVGTADAASRTGDYDYSSLTKISHLFPISSVA